MTSIYPPEDAFDVSLSNATAGATKDVSRFDLSSMSVQAVLTGGSYLLQGSNNGVNWVDVGGGAIIAAGLIIPSVPTHYLRIFTTIAADGAFTFYART